MPARIDTDQPGDDAGASMVSKLSQARFDPVDFLNDSLPTINFSKANRSTQMQSASTDSLAILSSLNTINARSSSDLTTLTDEIIRSGNRLAYEVEVLRGDANGLHDLLTESLRGDILHFVREEMTTLATTGPIHDAEPEDGTEAATTKDEPEFMTELRLLGKVKARLEAVVAVFGEAMKWPMPPSELSIASSLISVSSPELGIQNTAEDDKARDVLKTIRQEVNDLLGSEGDGYAGLEAASQRVEEYRQLAMLWKGTGEEKARAKFVDALSKVIEDKKKALDGRGSSRSAQVDNSTRSNLTMGRIAKGSSEGGGAAGLFRNLQRLKDDLYLE